MTGHWMTWCTQCGAPRCDVRWLTKTPVTIVIGTINHSYWSYVHQLSYRTGTPLCNISQPIGTCGTCRCVEFCRWATASLCRYVSPVPSPADSTSVPAVRSVMIRHFFVVWIRKIVFFFQKKTTKYTKNSRSPKLQLKLFINMGHSVIIPFAKVVSFQEKHLCWQIYNVDDIQLYYDI